METSVLRYQNLMVIPTYHGNLDFVHEVRKAFYGQIPDLIAIELPDNLTNLVLKAANRLPKISMIAYYDEFLREQLFIPIDPSDSLIEAVRLGQEYGIPIEFIDCFVKNYNPTIFARPDSYALNFISLEEFYTMICQEWKLSETSDFNYELNQIRAQQEQRKFEEEQDLLESEGETRMKSGTDAQRWIRNAEEIDNLRDHYMATKLHQLMEQHQQILVIMGLEHWETIRSILDHQDFYEDLTTFQTETTAEIYNIEEADLPKIITETPNIVAQWEKFRSKQKDTAEEKTDLDASQFNLRKFDQCRAITEIIFRSVGRFKEEYNETINLHKLKSLFQYMRNLPLMDHMITPTLFDIVLAAKSILNDEFAWIVWEECKRYPDAQPDPKLESAHFNESGVFLHGKYFFIRRFIPLRIRKIRLPLKPKPRENFTGEWRKIWNRNSWNLISHIPEDIFEENYFQHVRHRALNLMKDRFVKVHKFTSTLMDGIDFRETLRNWAYDQKIYVREERSIQGEVDAVIIVFDRDEDNVRYPYNMMWYAEHAHESDLALYCTHPGEFLVGPGISRVEIGGVVSFFPPRGIPDIWGSKFVANYAFAKSKADRLLLAGIIYAQKKFVVYSAKNPPKSTFISLAHKAGVEIIYIPLDHFNPVSLRALRNVHMLAGRHVREFVDKYVQKRRY